MSNKSMTARSSEKLTDSHYGTEPASFLQGNRDDIEAETSSTRMAFSEVLENSSVTSHSTVSGADSSCKKAEDIVMGAVDVRELNESTGARASQDGEQRNDDVLTDHCVEGNRWKSELTDASDDPIGGLGERLCDDPKSRESASSSSAHWLRTKHSRRATRRNSRAWAQFLTTQLTENSGRTQPSRMSRQQSSSTTSTGRKRSLQTQRRVRWTSLWRLRETSPGHTAPDCQRCCTAARRLEKTQRKWSEHDGSKHCQLSCGPRRHRWEGCSSTSHRLPNSWAQGRRVTTLRSRVRLARRYLAWLSINFAVTFPTELELMVDYFKVRASEPCTTGTLKNTHRSFTFLEEVAGMPKTECITENSLYQVLYHELLSKAAPGRPTRQAPRMLVAMLRSIDRRVVNEGELPYIRLYSWWTLLQNWATLRFDDHRGIEFASVRVSQLGLQARLTRQFCADRSWLIPSATCPSHTGSKQDGKS